jgi:hypothetical protein
MSAEKISATRIAGACGAGIHSAGGTQPRGFESAAVCQAAG